MLSKRPKLDTDNQYSGNKSNSNCQDDEETDRKNSASEVACENTPQSHHSAIDTDEQLLFFNSMRTSVSECHHFIALRAV